MDALPRFNAGDKVSGDHMANKNKRGQLLKAKTKIKGKGKVRISRKPTGEDGIKWGYDRGFAYGGNLK